MAGIAEATAILQTSHRTLIGMETRIDHGTSHIVFIVCVNMHACPEPLHNVDLLGRRFSCIVLLMWQVPGMGSAQCRWACSCAT